MRKFVATIFALTLLVGAAASTDAQGINHRQHHQQRRIWRGVRSGELTRRETRRLERGERGIRRNERRARSDGNVTWRERARLRHELNRESRHIYRAKHNRRDRN